MRLCVYCSSSDKIDPRLLALAEEIGEILAKNHITLIFGGGKHGMMGPLSYAVKKYGGEAIGYITGYLKDFEGGHSAHADVQVVDTMHTRKFKMAESADAFLILPGGFGTLDEFFEVFTWKQIALHHKPIIIMNAFQSWDLLIQLIDQLFDHRFADPADRVLYDVVTTTHELTQLLQRYRSPID